MTNNLENKIYEYLIKYGFGKTTNIDLQEETSGDLHPLKDWYQIDQATITFGQGIGITSIQMIRAFQALANNGKIFQPQVVNSVKEGNQAFIIKPSFSRQVISQETSKVITEMLVSVCEKSPLHFSRDNIPELKNFRIAAKSGTAQIAVGGQYKEGRTIGSVIGYFPAEDPQFLVLVILNEPQANIWGANTAGPIFFNITKALLIYYGISP